MQLFIAQRILLTLGYTDQFDFPLTFRELYSRLLVGFFVTPQVFADTVSFLHKRKLLNYVDTYFFIPGLSSQTMHDLAKIRGKKMQYSQKKWRELQEFVRFAKTIPFITGVAVTGSVAVNNATKDDDIDFMLVTAPHRLWLTRIVVILYASLKGKRRSFAKEEKNSWCFNLWVEETDLQLPIGSRSVYEAHEVIQAVWVLSKNRVAQRFRVLNRWTNCVVFTQKVDYSGIEQGTSILWELPVLSQLLTVLNACAFILQYMYMKQHMTREKVTATHAFFHPRDTKSAVFENWKKTLLRLV